MKVPSQEWRIIPQYVLMKLEVWGMRQIRKALLNYRNEEVKVPQIVKSALDKLKRRACSPAQG